MNDVAQAIDEDAMSTPGPSPGTLAAAEARAQGDRASVPGPADAQLVERLALANRILYDQGVVDGFGHVSVRHDRSDAHFLLERKLVPLAVEVNAIAVRGVVRADVTATRRALLAILANLAQDEASTDASASVRAAPRISRPSSRRPSPAARSR